MLTYILMEYQGLKKFFKQKMTRLGQICCWKRKLKVKELIDKNYLGVDVFIEEILE